MPLSLPLDTFWYFGEQFLFSAVKQFDCIDFFVLLWQQVTGGAEVFFPRCLHTAYVCNLTFPVREFKQSEGLWWCFKAADQVLTCRIAIKVIGLCAEKDLETSLSQWLPALCVCLWLFCCDR